ncbi:methanogenesis marker 17 protein [Methermicoccus shengliensis]|uniref:Methanogenesis marker 17 protein n=1 Tax=Methermicoccus shengliensis TaxID=660064 RepID=A0A832RZ38_9EURY|nr:methanogenesis marker 17 protein [Methermicoccus shengliensis]KUK04945.1 MAG: Methanogenesis marker protein 17 [Euryarchaeota archaeon 55_53]KUK30896.1 MAG: Methanogenesis marker protein 17 [Methanosarcinales archeaon 56_1174]MDI3487643.1 hypothetical protein [Methanosarcinales archaeon]MDN5294976.1 hypothetical protein [Methanosarcinales archaeon]HIH69981.1 methanogenesis marker 17 protein [Methermicoccus shengliensis]
MGHELVRVHSPDERGALLYKEVAETLIGDLMLARVIEHMRIYADPEEPVFIVVMLLRHGLQPAKIEDIATVKPGGPGEDMVLVEIRDEDYAVPLIRKLWSVYGRDGVEQPEQKVFAIRTQDKLKEIERVEKLVVEKPKEEVYERLADLLERLAPEGFRVKDTRLTSRYGMLIASENPLEGRWYTMAGNMLEDMLRETSGKMPDEEELREIEQRISRGCEGRGGGACRLW